MIRSVVLEDKFVSNAETERRFNPLSSSFFFGNLKLPVHTKLKGRNIIGQNMQRIRYGYDPVVTLDDLAARLEVRGLFLSKSTLSKIENSQRVALDFEVLEIAAALRVPITQLYDQR